MNAEEMFKKLGYKKTEESEGVLLYTSEFENNILFDMKRVTINDLYCNGGITINRLLENAIHKQCEELGWIEEEQKQETNYEHFKDEIIENSGYCFALADGKLHKCSDVYCCDCEFSTGYGCREKINEWLKSPYKKPTYKLNKFEYDLINTFDRCKECCLLNEIECLKKLIEKGYFNGIDPFTKVHDIIDNCEVIK